MPAGRPTEKLYSPQLLSLSADLANFPFDLRFPLVAEGRSRTCGSTIRLGLDRDGEGRVTRIGVQVAACAVGQSSASILARAIKGRTTADMKAILTEIEAWLTGEGDIPGWPDFDALAPARAHPGRHGALLMPWKAAVDALSSDEARG